MSKRHVAVGIVRDLQSAGYKAALVGGCVRDERMGRVPKDYDVATNATPAQIRQVFAGDSVHGIGESFGVILIVREGEHVEVATLRGDGQYSDGRRPDSVHFVQDFQADADRRDFTFNAMFEDPIAGITHDFHGGLKDIEARLIRAVGVAEERIAEDRLRMLRAVRFAARFNFAIEQGLHDAIRRHASEIKLCAGERIRKELQSILTEGNPVLGLDLLYETGLIEHILPEFLPMGGDKGRQSSKHHPEGTALVHTKMVLSELVSMVAAGKASNSFELMLGGLLHDIGKPDTQVITLEGQPPVERITNHGHESVGAEMARRICNRLKMSGAETTRVVNLVALHMEMHTYDEDTARNRWVKLMKRPHLDDHIALQHADAMGTGCRFCDKLAKSRFSLFARKKAELMSEVTRSMALDATAIIDGNVLKSMGLRPGPIFGVIINAAFDAQHDGEFADREGAEAWVRARLETFQTQVA